MELRKPFHERVYVEDDLPSFIRKGPSLHIMHPSGRPDSFAPPHHDPIHDVTLSNGYRSNDRFLPKEKLSETIRARPNHAPALKNWDNRFLLMTVGGIVSLNAILYLSFHPLSERSQLQRVGGRSVLIKNHSSSTPPLEDRIVTLRFTSSSYTEEPLAPAKNIELKPDFPILQQP